MGIFIFFVVIALILFGLRWYSEIFLTKYNPEALYVDLEAKNAAEVAADKLTASDEEIDDELLGVITAAAYSTVNRPMAIKSVRFLDSKENSSWASYGRMKQISHHDTQSNL